jgi:uncharacterized protein (DUF885 family)
MVKLNEIREGSLVQVRGCFGTGPLVTAKVRAVEKNIKNGVPGIDYVQLSNDEEHWAYLSQVARVVKF